MFEFQIVFKWIVYFYAVLFHFFKFMAEQRVNI